MKTKRDYLNTKPLFCLDTSGSEEDPFGRKLKTLFALFVFPGKARRKRKPLTGGKKLLNHLLVMCLPRKCICAPSVCCSCTLLTSSSRVWGIVTQTSRPTKEYVVLIMHRGNTNRSMLNVISKPFFELSEGHTSRHLRRPKNDFHSE